MKTIDEVIDAMERCSIPHYFDCKGCPYEDEAAETGCWSEDRDADVLYYLKMLRDMTCGTSQNFADTSQNNPLTWSELREMEGKPVWIEAESISVGVSPYWKGWYIISSFSDNEFMLCNDGYEWAKEMQGRMWQAYRKER